MATTAYCILQTNVLYGRPITDLAMNFVKLNVSGNEKNSSSDNCHCQSFSPIMLVCKMHRNYIPHNAQSCVGASEAVAKQVTYSSI